MFFRDIFLKFQNKRGLRRDTEISKIKPHSLAWTLNILGSTKKIIYNLWLRNAYNPHLKSTWSGGLGRKYSHLWPTGPVSRYPGEILSRELKLLHRALEKNQVVVCHGFINQNSVQHWKYNFDTKWTYIHQKTHLSTQKCSNNSKSWQIDDRKNSTKNFY